MKFSNLNKKQKIVLTILAIFTAALLVAGLAPTLFMCWAGQYGIVCQTSPEAYTPITAILLAYFVVELSVMLICLVAMMWLNKKSITSTPTPDCCCLGCWL
ncbi:MAG: hypothetical protein AAB600_01990 [Patescibacteria group bacterium]